jgi:HAD domain in Swiss Army Knife RNA repair proteins
MAYVWPACATGDRVRFQVDAVHSKPVASPASRSELIDSISVLLYWPSSTLGRLPVQTCMGAKERVHPTEELHGRAGGRRAEKPLLMVDIDGVISLFGFADQPPWIERQSAQSADRGSHELAHEIAFHTVEGIPHCLSRTAAAHLCELAADFELVWASGWEERAEEHLPALLGLPAGLPFLRFERMTGPPPTRGVGSANNAHWKLSAVESYAATRPLAWIDDSFNDACHDWAHARPAPTLLVQTNPARGLTSAEASQLTDWAQAQSHRSIGGEQR